MEANCGKCEGKGFLSHYAGIANGTCFSCGGSGVRLKHARSRQPKYSVGDTIKKNGYKNVFEIVEIRPKHYLTACHTKLSRHIDRYPEDSKDGYIKIS